MQVNDRFKAKVRVDADPSLLMAQVSITQIAWNLAGVRRVPYQLRELLEAEPKLWVLIPEGEKDVDHLRSLGFVATCNAGGAGKWRPEYSQFFVGRKVVILPDNDDPGRDHADAIANSLEAVVTDLRVLSLPGLSEKEDVSDWISAGGSAAGLQSLIEETGEWSRHSKNSLSRSSSRDVAPYGADEKGLFWRKKTADGSIEVPLTNFSAKVIRETIRDDGTETRRMMEIEATLNGKMVAGVVTMTSFQLMRWPTEFFGASAVIHPGRTEYARAAISTISTITDDIPSTVIFTHSGWRQVDDRMVYLHAGGAISEQGTTNIAVELDGPLADYCLPEPPGPEKWHDAMSAVLRILEITDESIGIALLGSAFDAVLGGADYSIFIEGSSGQRKSALAAVIQSFWGKEFDGNRLPANWSSTANANAEKQHTMKDAILTIDDYKPPSDSRVRAKLEQDGDRIFRGAANHSGRARMNADGSLRPEKPPRCLTLATGEDVPIGQSLRARILILRIPPDGVRLCKLSECQEMARSGVFSSATAGYLRWLAPRIQAMQRSAASEIASMRDDLGGAIAGHGRIPTTISRLQRGWNTWLLAASECGAISEDQFYVLTIKVRDCLRAVGNAQMTYQKSQDAAGRFMELLIAAIASGRATIADAKTGRWPQQPTAWGWVQQEIAASTGQKTIYEERGEIVGWLDGTAFVYLQPDAAYQVAQRMAISGDGLAVSQSTLWRRLEEAGMLAGHDKGHLTTKKTIASVRRRVVVLRAEIFGVATDEDLEHSVGHDGQRAPF